VSRKKTPRINEFKTLPNALVSPVNMKGNWSTHFGNNHPISVELGCGKGEYTNRLGKEFPDRNFIGIDLKGARLWRGAKNAIADGLNNVRFLLINIGNILDYFDSNEVSELYIPFPDPFPKPCKHKKRLVSERFMILYKNILIPEGIVHFKTDNTDLYNYTLSVIDQGGHKIIVNTDDLYHSDLIDLYNSIPTYFEQVFIEQGMNIKYIRFSLNKL
jgi:tRNA (guanine-N7-)-methyltransferase